MGVAQKMVTLLISQAVALTWAAEAQSSAQVIWAKIIEWLLQVQIEIVQTSDPL